VIDWLIELYIKIKLFQYLYLGFVNVDIGSDRNLKDPTNELTVRQKKKQIGWFIDTNENSKIVEERFSNYSQSKAPTQLREESYSGPEQKTQSVML